jgi:Mn-dependent DtxR family transcriptional regulator
VARGPNRRVSALDVLEVMVASSDPAFFTSELADELDTTAQTIRNRIDELEDNGYVDVKRDGRSMIIWLTQEGYEHYVDSR